MKEDERIESKLKELEEALKGEDGQISEENKRILEGIREDVKSIEYSKERIKKMKKDLKDGS